MQYTSESFLPQCDCGRNHEVTIKGVYIGPDAAYYLRDAVPAAGLSGKAVAVYDGNTWEAMGQKAPSAAREIVLPPHNLHADEHGVEQVMAKLDSADFLYAVGSGTVHDITRYCAAKIGVPFVSMPTAASVDGFASTVAAMTWHGFKKTMPGVAPTLIAADIDVLAAAPMRLTRSGVGDILGKYVCLADWQIGHALTGEYFCEGIYGMMRRAVDIVSDCIDGLVEGDKDAFEKLQYGLVLSGIAMQLAGNSRPASGAEHHVSHLIEIGVPWLEKSDALHGEKVGVGTLLCAEQYNAWKGKDLSALMRAVEGYAPLDKVALEPAFAGLTDEVLEENANDCLLDVQKPVSEATMTKVSAALASVPEASVIRAALERTGALLTLADIGVREDAAQEILYWSPYVRNRLTFMRLLHCLGK